MLKKLHIENFAIIDDLEVPFGPGLNILTGETGAGKSIIIEALGLILGDKASSDLVRSGSFDASVTAEFERNGKQMVISRSISLSGRSKALIDGRPAALSELKEVASKLIEISSQHEHQSLLKEETHIDIIDRYGKLGLEKSEYTKAYSEFVSLKNRLEELEKLASTAAEQREFLQFQVSEIDRAKLKEGEFEELERERSIAKNGAELVEKIKFIEGALVSSEGSIGSSMSEVGEMIAAAEKIDSALAGWSALFNEAFIAIEELSRNVAAYSENMDIDPSRLDEIEARLFEIKRLGKKHGGDVSEILKTRDRLFEKLNLINNVDDEIENVKQALASVKKVLKKTAVALSEKRERAALKLSGLIQKELESLGLRKTTFMSGHIRMDMGDANENGIDRFSFLISPNPGEPLKSLIRIASGGELSRIMLAIKSVLMDSEDRSVLEVFDEVDVGIGGAVAEMVGAKLKEMASRRQIISITHLAQVACFGDSHIYITKSVEGNRTITGFRLLDEESRIDEVARMLGGKKITRATLEHAKEMLKGKYGS